MNAENEKSRHLRQHHISLRLKPLQQRHETEVLSWRPEMLEGRFKQKSLLPQINSFKIDKALFEQAKKCESVHLQNLESINTLISLHLKRLNVKTKSREEQNINGLDLFSQSSKNHSFVSIQEIRNESKELIKSIEGLKPLSTRVGTMKEAKHESDSGESLEKKMLKNKIFLNRKFRTVERMDKDLIKNTSKGNIHIFL